ncbi:unnamed protein product [Brassica oleracea]
MKKNCYICIIYICIIDQKISRCVCQTNNPKICFMRQRRRRPQLPASSKRTIISGSVSGSVSQMNRAMVN